MILNSKVKKCPKYYVIMTLCLFLERVHSLNCERKMIRLGSFYIYVCCTHTFQILTTYLNISIFISNPKKLTYTKKYLVLGQFSASRSNNHTRAQDIKSGTNKYDYKHIVSFEFQLHFYFSMNVLLDISM